MTAVVRGCGPLSARAKFANIVASNRSQRGKACHRTITRGNVFSFLSIAIKNRRHCARPGQRRGRLHRQFPLSGGIHACAILLTSAFAQPTTPASRHHPAAASAHFRAHTHHPPRRLHHAAQTHARPAPLPLMGPPGRSHSQPDRHRMVRHDRGPGFVLSFGYWCTDFLVIQRAMAAKDMNSARRTPLIAATPMMRFPALVIPPACSPSRCINKAVPPPSRCRPELTATPTSTWSCP